MYPNSTEVHITLKYIYSVISLRIDSLPVNNKNGFDPFWNRPVRGRPECDFCIFARSMMVYFGVSVWLDNGRYSLSICSWQHFDTSYLCASFFLWGWSILVLNYHRADGLHLCISLLVRMSFLVLHDEYEADQYWFCITSILMRLSTVSSIDKITGLLCRISSLL